MALTVQFNKDAHFAIRQQTQHAQSLSTRFERLSTGLRINRAGDDSAGLSIATRMESQVVSLNRRTQNAQDALSFSQTSESILGEIETSLQRMRELSVQAASAPLNEQDRTAVQAEIDELKENINQMSQNQFNGLDIFGQQRGFFVSEDESKGVQVGLGQVASKNLGQLIRVTSNQSIDTSRVLGDDDFSITVDDQTTQIRGASAVDDTLSTSLRGNSAIAKAAAINTASKVTGVTALVENTVAGSNKLNETDLTSTNYLKINGASITGFTVLENDADGSLKDAINSVADQTGVIASQSSIGTLVLNAKDGRNIEIDVIGSNTLIGFQDQVIGGRITLQSEEQFEAGFVNKANLGLGELVTTTLPGGSTIVKSSDGKTDINTATSYNTATASDFFTLGGLVDFSGNYGGAPTEFQVTILGGTIFFDDLNGGAGGVAFTGDGSYVVTGTGITLSITNSINWDTDVNDDGAVDAFRFTAEPGPVVFGAGEALIANKPLSVDTIDITSEEGADQALYVLDFALSEITQGRTDLGAVQNRLESTVRNLTQTSQSLSSAQSRIQDADFAVETAELSRTQIV
jgi:flagellin